MSTEPALSLGQGKSQITLLEAELKQVEDAGDISCGKIYSTKKQHFLQLCFEVLLSFKAGFVSFPLANDSIPFLSPSRYRTYTIRKCTFGCDVRPNFLNPFLQQVVRQSNSCGRNGLPANIAEPVGNGEGRQTQ